MAENLLTGASTFRVKGEDPGHLEFAVTNDVTRSGRNREQQFDCNIVVNNDRTTKPEMNMLRKYLAGLSLVLLLAGSCVRYDGPVAREPADTTTQAQASAAMSAPEAASPDGHTSRNSLDWAGTYSGVLPCADCPGIETSVILHSDGTYESSMFYIDESAIPQTTNGTFSWNETGSTIVLDSEGEVMEQYQVGENQLFRLDRNGQRITGDLAPYYVLRKHVNDPAIEGKRWKLVELRGKPVETEQNAILMLSAEDTSASGNTSCNSFSGGYAIKSGQRISFARNIAVTRRACPDMSIESAFLEVLAMADNYSVNDDSMFSLNRARMAPLARFELAEGLGQAR